MLSRFRKLGIKQLWDRKFVRTKSSDKDVIIYNKGDLQAMTRTTLQAMAKERKINLKGKRRKHEIVNIMSSYFLKLKSSILDTEILPTNFDIATDPNGNINISLWFKGTGNKFSRCINSKKFKDLVTFHCEIEKKQKNDVMVEIDGELYVHPVIALYAASFLSTRVRHDILDFYVNKFRWNNFDASYAFYYFVIDNVVKCGAVGLKDQKNPENLNARLASHQSIHAGLILINVIKFKDSKTVSHFENWIKSVLEKYSIGTNTSLEQYECPEENSAKIIDKIILEEFDRLNEMNPRAGSVWPQKYIEQYNETMVTKTKA